MIKSLKEAINVELEKKHFQVLQFLLEHAQKIHNPHYKLDIIKNNTCCCLYCEALFDYARKKIQLDRDKYCLKSNPILKVYQDTKNFLKEKLQINTSSPFIAADEHYETQKLIESMYNTSSGFSG